MKNPDFTTSVAVDASVQAAFNAINNVRGWWSENIEGDTDTLNGEFTHRDKYLIVKMKITHLSAEKIVWDIVESHNTMFLENPGEWNNTKIVLTFLLICSLCCCFVILGQALAKRFALVINAITKCFAGLWIAIAGTPIRTFLRGITRSDII